MLIVPGLYTTEEFFLFRPIGHGHYKEVKFFIVKEQLIEQNHCKLHQTEKDYINNTLIV